MSLQSRLKSALPQETFEILHLQSFPRKAAKILGTSSLTIKAKHLVVIALNDIPLFALEAIVYIVFSEKDPRKIIYISKVDSTGLAKANVSFTAVVIEILKFLVDFPASNYCDAYIDPKAQKPRPKRAKKGPLAVKSLKSYLFEGKLKFSVPKVLFSSVSSSLNQQLSTEICLFTRAEPHYLFPGSEKNSGKHILSDRSLLQWWLKVLDKVVSDKDIFTNCDNTLSIPGEERHIVNKYLSKLSEGNWRPGGVFEDKSGALAVDEIPLFPDDPKARFLEHLVVEDRINKVTTAQFWNELAVRQEFRLGRVVGIIHVKGTAIKDRVISQSSKSSFTLELTQQNLHQLKLNNFEDDLIRVSNSQFTFLKDLLTSGAYFSQEGAKLAYTDLQYVLQTGCGYRGHAKNENYGFKLVKGTSSTVRGPANKHTGAPVQMLTIKRKKK